jgi:hypothetical protein
MKASMQSNELKHGQCNIQGNSWSIGKARLLTSICIPYKTDQTCFYRAVTWCSWLEGTMLHTSQQSTKITLISLPSILPLVVHGSRRYLIFIFNI